MNKPAGQDRRAEAEQVIRACFAKYGVRLLASDETSHHLLADDVAPDGESKVSVNLQGFVAKLLDNAREDWDGYAERLIGTARRMLEQSRLPQKLPVLSDLRPRFMRDTELRPEPYLPSEADPVLFQIGPLELGLVIEHPDSFSFLPRSTRDEAFPDLTDQQLLEATIENLRKQNPKPEKVGEDDKLRFYYPHCGDGSNNSALILLIREVLGTEWPLSGVVFSIPSQDLLFLTPLSLEDPVLDLLYTVTTNRMKEMNRPVLTPRFYWTDGIQPPEPFELDMQAVPGARVIRVQAGPRALAAIRNIGSPHLN